MSKWLFCAAMVLSMAWTGFVAAEETPETYVTTLEDGNFDAFIQNGYSVVDFFAHWCPPCRRTLPEFEKVAEEMHEQASFGKLNVDNSTTAPRMNVRVIPTIIVFKNGTEIARRQGGGDAEALTNFVTDALTPNP